MKKLTKAAGIIAVGIAAGTAYSFIKNYRTMKKMEEKLDKMPVNQLIGNSGIDQLFKIPEVFAFLYLIDHAFIAE